MTLAVETQRLTRFFGEVCAVNDVDLKVERGTFYGFLGPNGAGKSTTIKMLTGMLAPTHGEISLLGRNPLKPAEALEVKRQIGVVPEELALFENLTAREWDRKIHFPVLSEDRSAVLFEVKMDVPPETVQGLKEISGTLEYVVATSSKKVDVGITDFVTGAKGKELNASIESIEPSKWSQGNETLKLKLGVSKDSVKSVTVFDSDSNELAFSSTSTSWQGDSVTHEFSKKGKLPSKGRIVVEVYDGLQKYQIPFSLTDISLLGRPL